MGLERCQTDVVLIALYTLLLTRSFGHISILLLFGISAHGVIYTNDSAPPVVHCYLSGKALSPATVTLVSTAVSRV